MRTETRPFFESAGIHAALVVAAVAVFALKTRVPTETVDLTVIEAAPPPTVVLQPKVPKPVPEKKQQAVFGLRRQALTVSEPTPAVPEVKTGNTVTKEEDTQTLNSDSPESLPIPSAEYLVSRMPVLRSDFRVAYPAGARRRGIEGPVVMDLLIDAQGKVRTVALVEAIDQELAQAASEAAKRFQFQAAEIDGKAVAVKIRYTYRFVLERD